MTIRLAVIADDLTGALDTSSPFALAGLRVVAATRPEALAEALAADPDVVVVNTASRALPASEAARIAGEIATALRQARPGIVFKKIDSRLKGNVAAETEAVARAFGMSAIVASPAIPDQQRPTVGGAVTGRGVGAPIAIAPLLPPNAHVLDAATDADLDAIAASFDWRRTLAVGARGLGLALARQFGPARPHPFEPSAATLFAIGSHDPLTLAQIARLRPEIMRHEAPLGDYRGGFTRLPALLQSTGPFAGPDIAMSARFAEAVHRAVEALDPDTLVMGGGDTALAILDRLGARTVIVEGEAAPGLPLFLIARANRPSIRCIVKSGGFGGPETLGGLLKGAIA